MHPESNPRLGVFIAYDNNLPLLIASTASTASKPGKICSKSLGTQDLTKLRLKYKLILPLFFSHTIGHATYKTLYYIVRYGS